MNPTTPSTDNKVDSIVPQDTMKEVLNRAYNQGIDHAIQIVNNHVDGDNKSLDTILAFIVSDLEKLKSK